MVTKSAKAIVPLHHPIPATAEVDTPRVNAYTWIDAGLKERPYGARSGSVLHQRGRANAWHAPADAAEVRAARADSAVAHHRQHAVVLSRGARTDQAHQASRGRWRHQSGGG